MRRLVVLVILLMIISSSLVWGLSGTRSDSSPAPVEQTVEDYLVSKTSKTPISSRFTPVLMYRYLGGESALHCGVGTLFVGPSGECVITAEHLMRKELGDQIFAYRKLQPLETVITHSIEGVQRKGVEFALNPDENPDVVMLKPGLGKKIACYDMRARSLVRGRSKIRKVLNTVTVRSLVSGERVQVLGQVMGSGDDGSAIYTIIKYAAVPGESGTGFVDDADGLYVLKGSFEASDDRRDEFEKTFGAAKGMTLVYGPLRIK